jgi:quinol-cytochrome oxidoreductase complex cytochrome b subunit
VRKKDALLAALREVVGCERETEKAREELFSRNAKDCRAVNLARPIFATSVFFFLFCFFAFVSSSLHLSFLQQMSISSSNVVVCDNGTGVSASCARNNDLLTLFSFFFFFLYVHCSL